MANITDQFVTSFSELYYSTNPVVNEFGNAVTVPTEDEIRSWFTTPRFEQEIVITLVPIIASSANDADGSPIPNLYSVEVDGLTVSAESLGTLIDDPLNPGTDILDASIEAAQMAAAINNDRLLLSVSVLGNVITVSGERNVGSYDFFANSNVTVGFLQLDSGLNDGLTIDAVFIAGTRLVPLVMEIGTLSNEATVIDTPTFGEIYRGKLRGQLDGGQLDAQLYWAPRNDVHAELRTLAETGQEVYVGIKWKNSAGDNW